MATSARLVREGLLCARAHAVQGPGGLPIAPSVVSTGLGEIVFEAVQGKVCDRILDELPDDDADRLGSAVGVALAALHAASVTGLPEALSVASPLTDLAPRHLRFLTGETIRVVRRLQGVPGLLAALQQPLEPVRTCFIHNDLKLDNVLVRSSPPGAVVLVDWELAGAGDPARDVGTIVADNLARTALRALTVRRASGADLPPPSGPSASGDLVVARFLRGFLDGYAAAGTVGLDSARVAQHAGIALLNAALAHTESRGRYSRRADLLALMGARLLLHPDALARTLSPPLRAARRGRDIVRSGR